MDEEFPLQGQAIWLECRANLWPKISTLLGIIQAPMGAANWPTGRPMPPGIGTWSGGCQAQNSWHCGKHVSPVPPHPGPLPKGEGELSAAGRQIEAARHRARRPTEHPLLGERAGMRGEWGRRTVAAAQ